MVGAARRGVTRISRCRRHAATRAGGRYRPRQKPRQAGGRLPPSQVMPQRARHVTNDFDPAPRPQRRRRVARGASMHRAAVVVRSGLETVHGAAVTADIVVLNQDLGRRALAGLPLDRLAQRGFDDRAAVVMLDRHTDAFKRVDGGRHRRAQHFLHFSSFFIGPYFATSRHVPFMSTLRHRWEHTGQPICRRLGRPRRRRLAPPANGSTLVATGPPRGPALTGECDAR